MDPAIVNEIKTLRQYRDRYYTTAKVVFRPTSGNIYQTDFLFIGAFNRSFCLLRAFCDLLESANFVSAAPIARLQLDCSLRIVAADLVEDSAALVSAVLEGTPINKLKDRQGNQLTDSRLLEALENEYPWIRKVYKEGSGFVHLSDKHIFNTLQIQSEEKRTISLKISDRDMFVPDEAYRETIDVFTNLCDLFLTLMDQYGQQRQKWHTGGDSDRNP